MNTNNNDFCVFILSHGRPNNIKTLTSLHKHGYTGPIYIVVDTKDKTLPEYINKYSNMICTFDKDEIAKKFDVADNFNKQNTVVYARNACFEIAKKLGYTYFLQLDDDYTAFRFRILYKKELWGKNIKNLDFTIDKMLTFYRNNPNIQSIAMSQGGDFFGGYEGATTIRYRKCMNSFFCSIDRPFMFIGNINEDVNTYTRLGNTGMIFLTIFAASLNQITTQHASGGMTDIYKTSGTYIKSFYSILYMPSSVKIRVMPSVSNTPRLHHIIKWNNTVPCIISDKYKK